MSDREEIPIIEGLVINADYSGIMERDIDLELHVRKRTHQFVAAHPFTGICRGHTSFRISRKHIMQISVAGPLIANVVVYLKDEEFFY